MSAENAFITELRKQDIPIQSIIDQLQTNFKLTIQSAQLKIANWASEIQQRADLYENKKERTIITNVGFPVIITRDATNNTVTVTINTINNIKYLNYIHIYIDSILRLFANKKSIGISATNLNLLCKGKAIKMKSTDYDVEADDDKDFLDRPTNQSENKIVFDDDVDDYLDDLLGDSDEDSDEDSGDISFGEDISPGDISFGEDISPGDISFGEDIGPSPPNKTPSPLQSMESSPQSGSEASEAEIDLTGLPLRGSKSIFMKNNTMKRGLQWRDPKLFIKTGKGRYSTACGSQYGKQPIVLTSTEKKYIDDKDDIYKTKSYDESITYSSGEEKYHYICPRFWCLNDENGKQRSITLKEINAGGKNSCGGWDALIPRNAKKIPEGGRIYEFTDQRFHRDRYDQKDTDNILVYKPMFPGFQEKTKHPDNLCVPCCYGRPRGLSQKAKDEGWTVEEKDKKLYFKNKLGDKVNKNTVPRTSYDGSGNTNYMYKPEGEGNGNGVGPTFERDSKGNIKLDTIEEGTPQLRELPAGRRISTINDCNQTIKKVGEKTSTQNTLKMEEAPAWEVFPLKTGQLGYLPDSVQKFFQYNQIPPKGDSSLRLKKDKPVFLRKGMERNKTQSFLSCIADMYEYYMLSSQERETPIELKHTTDNSIQWIKDVILKHLNLDNFVTFQNGTLVDLFYKKDSLLEDRDIELYKDNILYKKLSQTKPDYLLKIINALNNFKAYLSNDTVEINYEYIWDIICVPHAGKNNELGGIFADGLNLLILKSPNDDITNKIEVICPTNFYGTGYFDNKREILILYTRDGYYEPVYKYMRTSTHDFKINKLLFLPKIDTQAPQLAKMIKYVRKMLIDSCKPLPSNEKYKFKENISVSQLLQAIQKCQKTAKYSIEAQVLNLNTKVIGIMIKKGRSKPFLVPCRPSELRTEMPFILADDPDIINSFSDTLEALQNLCVKSKCNIYCKPILKIVNNNIIVGIITETNQFVPVKPEPQDKSYIDNDRKDENGLIVIENNNGVENYLTQPSLENNAVDDERIQAVNDIKLESQLYNSFRNILRITINQLKNKMEVKNKLIDILNNITMPYYSKLKNIIKMLHSIMDDYVAFTDYKISSKLAVNSILKCINVGEKKCTPPTCLYVKENGKCKLQISRKNLISDNNNEEVYFGRLADELIRYSRIRIFILNPRQFLGFQQIPYNLKEDEIILLEAILYGDYFEDITPQYINPFIASKNIFDVVEPSISIPYKDTFILDNMMNTEAINQCLVTKDKKLKLEAYLRVRKLSPDFTLLEFKHDFMCTWEVAIFVLNDFGLNITVKDLQELLQQTYSSYSQSDKMSDIIDLWKKEGKQPLIQALTYDLTGTINPEDYYLTPLDYFFIFNNYECPCVITSRTKICLYAHLNIAFYKEKHLQNVYVIFGGAWNTKRTDNIKLPIYGLLQRNGSIRLPIMYFGNFGERLIQNPITTFDQYNSYMSKVQQIKIKGIKKKKLGKLRLG